VSWSKLKCIAEVVDVRPMSSDCTCGDPRHAGTRAIVHPDGWHVTCLTCGAEWVEYQLREVTAAAAAQRRG
jgi:hypothetical protein